MCSSDLARAPPPPAGPRSAGCRGAAGGAGRRAALRARFCRPRSRRAESAGRARVGRRPRWGAWGEAARGAAGAKLRGQMPEGAAALRGCRCCPCGPRVRLRGRRCPRRGVCTERVKVCVAGAAGAAAATATALAGPNACHFPGRWQLQPGAPEPSAGLPVLPRDLIG